jgi:hypothetical protein
MDAGRNIFTLQASLITFLSTPDPKFSNRRKAVFIKQKTYDFGFHYSSACL